MADNNTKQAIVLGGKRIGAVQGNGAHMLEAVYIQAAKPEATQLSLFGGYA